MNKTKTLTIGIVVLVVLAVGVVLLLRINDTKETTTPEIGVDQETEPVTEVEEPVAEEKTPIEIAFDEAEDVEIESEEAKAVDAVLRPVLKDVFDTVVDEETVVGVKMKEEFGPMMTYVFNRKLTEVERDAIVAGLEEVGVIPVDSTEKVVTVKKGSDMWVITFFLNDEQKSGLDITF
jgi:predicted dinucleotide-utilizing enzyme